MMPQQTAKSGENPDSDGCTVLSAFHVILLGRDLMIRPCCEEHDLFYAQGGTRQDRAFADTILRQCVRDMGYPVAAWFVWAGVRLFGGRFWGKE